MAGRTIVWSKSAQLLFDDVLSYFTSSPNSRNFGKKLHKDVTELTSHLLKFPDLGKAVENSDYREFIIGNYSLFYKVLDAHIFIAIFWDNRRNPELIKMELSKAF